MTNKETLKEKENQSKSFDSEQTKEELTKNLSTDKKEGLWPKFKKKFSSKGKKEEEPKEKFIVTKDTVKPLLFSWSGDNFLFRLDDYILEGITRNEIAEILVEHNRGYMVTNHLDQFPDLDQMAFIKKMIDLREGPSIILFYEKFDKVDDVEVADYLIEHGAGYSVVSDYQKFKGLNDKHIVNKLLENKSYEAVVQFLPIFKGINKEEIMDAVIESGNGYLIVNNLDKFNEFDKQEIARKLIETGQSICVANNITKFGRLNQELLDKLITNGFANEALISLRQ